MLEIHILLLAALENLVHYVDLLVGQRGGTLCSEGLDFSILFFEQVSIHLVHLVKFAL